MRVIIAKVDSTDNVKGILSVTVMEADVPDSDGEVTSWGEVEKAAHDFLRKGKVKCVDHNHNMQIDNDIDVVASYPDEITKSWKAQLDISGNAEILQKAKDGKITGVSIYARGVRTPVEKKKKSIMKSITDFFTIKKAQYSKRSFENAISQKADLLRWSLADAVWENRENPEQMESDIVENIRDFTSEIMTTLESTDLENINKNKGADMNKEEAAELIAKSIAAEFDKRDTVAKAAAKDDLIKSQGDAIKKLEEDILKLKKDGSTPDTPKVGGETPKEDIKKTRGIL